MQTKSEIRAYISEIKKSMSDTDIASLSEAIINQLITSDEYINSDNVLVYVSYNQEVRTDILIKQSIKAGKNVYVPKVFKDKDVKYMEFVKIKSYQDLAPGYMGIMEPVIDDYASLKDGLLVMPGIAFDTQKNRIGYGGGFYDRYLQQHMSDFYKTAICFDYQIVEHIMSEEFDIKPDKIITEKRIIN